MVKKPVKHAPARSAPPKPKPAEPDDEPEEIEEETEVTTDPDDGTQPAAPPEEPNTVTDDPADPAEPKPTGPVDDLKQAAANAKKAVDEDRAREVPVLETYKAASLQKQADWENDAKEFFRDEDFEKKRRDERIAQMDAMDIKNRAAQRERDAEHEKEAKEAERHELEVEAASLRKQADNLDAMAAAMGA